MIVKEGNECAERITELIGMPELKEPIAVICSQYILDYYKSTSEGMRDYYTRKIQALENMSGIKEGSCD